ncbi:MAG TPA: tripartite tricarboxylate transporter permease [Methanocorpusculum sp.]|nr:tripartite tricarboxylate transporter permease [Methanocorpusculum sp.]
MLEIALGILAGAVLGTVSGLVPGIHSNTFAGLIAAFSLPLAAVFGSEGICAAIVSMAVVHTFLDAVPSTFLGVPDADTVISALPAHRLYLEGKGEEAVRVSNLGSLWGFVLALPLFALFYFFLGQAQGFVDWGIGLVILLAAGLLIVFSASPGWAFLIMLATGALGVFAMQFSYLSAGIFSVGEVMLPLLTGLFAVPVLLTSIKAVPVKKEQKFSGIALLRPRIMISGIKGAVAGAIVGWLPGFSSGTANALLAVHKNPEKANPREYLVATSAANTANALLGIAALYAVGRMRSGSMAVLAEFELPPVLMIVFAAGAAAMLGFFLTIAFSKSSKVVARINQRYLSFGVLVFLVVLTMLCTGWFGIVIMLLAAALGRLPVLCGLPRIFCMGAIMVPVMLFSLGLI